MTLQQIIDERVSFLKEQINPGNKPEVNKTFQIQIDVIRSIDDDDMEKVESIISQKKAQLKNSKDIHESDRLFAELDALEWLQRQIAVYTLDDNKETAVGRIDRCSICSKKLKFARTTTENPLTCWQCMIVNVDS